MIADEITALGWRLAGARVLIPEQRTVEECFRTALNGADMVIITAQLSAALPAGVLDEALHSQPPLVAVIADLQHKQEPPDIEVATLRALGVGI